MTELKYILARVADELAERDKCGRMGRHIIIDYDDWLDVFAKIEKEYKDCSVYSHLTAWTRMEGKGGREFVNMELESRLFSCGENRYLVFRDTHSPSPVTQEIIAEDLIDAFSKAEEATIESWKREILRINELLLRYSKLKSLTKQDTNEMERAVK